MTTHVLVLGAGASKHYNFPLAREIAHAASMKQWEIQRFREMGFDAGAIESFADSLRASLSTSVDDFLNYESDPQVVAVGKAILAYFISAREERTHLSGLPQSHWYELLASRLIVPNLDDFPRRDVAVVTFNYDRSLDRCILDSLVSRFRSRHSIEQIVLAFRRLPIVHIYGQLGALPELAAQGELSRAYGPIQVKEQMDTAVAAMRLLPEVTTIGRDGTNVDVAQGLIYQAEHISFLGFAYSEDNLEALGLRRSDPSQKHYYGTTLGFESSEQISELNMRLAGHHVRLEQHWKADVATAMAHYPRTLLGDPKQ